MYLVKGNKEGALHYHQNFNFNKNGSEKTIFQVIKRIKERSECNVEPYTIYHYIWRPPSSHNALSVQVAGATAHEHNAVLLSPWIIPLVEFQIKNRLEILYLDFIFLDHVSYHYIL